MIYNEIVFKSYIQRPYLSRSTQEQVTRRHDAICANLWVAPPPGNPILHENPSKSLFWDKKLIEVRTERFRRSVSAGLYRGPPERFIGFDETNVLSRAILDSRVLNAVRNISLPSAPFLVRFTDARHVQDALTRGRFRIAQAAEYNDSSLNAAQRDDELSHAAVRGDRRLAVELIGHAPGENPNQARPISVQWGEMFEYMNSTNFYVLCLTDRFDARMFRDFTKDAAIIIRDPFSFVRRLGEVTRSQFPELEFMARPVSYYDPYTIERGELVPGFSKNFSFSYQNEFRLTWWPRDQTAQLSPFFIEIGSLADIADAIYL